MGRRRTLGKKRRRRTNKRSTMMRRRRTINKMRGGGKFPYPGDTDDIKNAKEILQRLTPKNNGDGNDVAHGDKSYIMSNEEIMKGLRENIENLNIDKQVTKTEKHAQTEETTIYKYTVKEENIGLMTLYYLHYNIIVDGDIIHIMSCSVKAFNDLLQENIKYILSHLKDPLTIIKPM